VSAAFSDWRYTGGISRHGLAVAVTVGVTEDGRIALRTDNVGRQVLLDGHDVAEVIKHLRDAARAARGGLR
jgi:hypothetical protein